MEQYELRLWCVEDEAQVVTIRRSFGAPALAQKWAAKEAHDFYYRSPESNEVRWSLRSASDRIWRGSFGEYET